jgi:hypothetical protein
LVFLLLTAGCSEKSPYSGKKDLSGYWHCKTVEITSPANEKTGFSIYKYGYGFVAIEKDSLYESTLEILKDVVLEKSVFGNSYKKTLIQGGYKSFRKGYYKATDSLITFYDVNNRIVNDEEYYFDGRVLYTKFKDREDKLWIISWEKDN